MSTPANKLPKVSVCVVTYNQAQYITACLQSVVAQITDFEFEVIVSDDGSTDGTAEIIKKFAADYDFIVPVLRAQNIGAFKNFVHTHNMARGEYVCHLDGDDYWLPGKLQKQYAYLELHPACTVVWHKTNLFDDAGHFLSGTAYDYSMFEHGIVTFENGLRFGAVAAHSSIMYRKCSRKTINPNFDVIDLFYTWEYLSAGWGAILDDVLGGYRVNSNSLMSIKKSEYYVRKLSADHAQYFLKLYPNKRKDIFIFAFTHLLADLKNQRKTAIDFFILVLKTFSFIKLDELTKYVKLAHKLRKPRLVLTK